MKQSNWLCGPAFLLTSISFPTISTTQLSFLTFDHISHYWSWPGGVSHWLLRKLNNSNFDTQEMTGLSLVFSIKKSKSLNKNKKSIVLQIRVLVPSDMQASSFSDTPSKVLWSFLGKIWQNCLPCHNVPEFFFHFPSTAWTNTRKLSAWLRRKISPVPLLHVQFS